ncbi:MAG: cupin domain-containing protein [Emcibacteraceae bacterium]|nr:cupin domain-containing protein [Emcibacteraceae bacterium]
MTINNTINSTTSLIKTLAVLILIICSASLFLSSSYAQETGMTQTRVGNNILSGEALGEFKPYEPENGNILARSHEFYQSENGQYATGIWEGKPGTMKIENAPYAEVMYIVEGSLAMGSQENTEITYTAGEGIVMPKGWSGNFTVNEGGVKMIWSNYTNDRLSVSGSTELVLMDRDTLAGRRFSEFRPFDPDVSDIIARDHEFYRTVDGKFGIDVWEAQPGEVPFADLGYDEMIYVLEGNMSFINTNGDAEIYSEGKAVVLPSGWSGKGVVSTTGARVMIFWFRN